MPQSRLRRYLRHGTLPQLAVFEASARLSSFTRAAAELHLAQPTVSGQIRKLSETLGTPLFEQVGRQIQLTPSGRCAYDHCLEVLAAIGRLDDALADLRDLAAGELRLAIAGAATRFVARMASDFSQCYPGIAVRLHVDNRAGLLARLARHEDDLYLFAHPPQGLPVVRQAITSNPLVIVARRDDDLARERALSLARVAAAPFVMREPGSGTRASVLEAFARAGLSPNIRMELASDEAIRCAVSEGAGIAALPRDSLDAGDAFSMVDVAGFPIERHWHFVYPVGVRVARAAEAFMRHVRDEAAAPDGRREQGEAAVSKLAA
ncbi:MAG: LysR family transcriptional regulator [Burkholderiales bacterium]|nr:LysR family transcriptional regulator [Burkholderiales bacterium]